MHPMASFKTMLVAFILTLAMSASAASNECPANKEMSCESLRSSHGYTYTVPPDVPCSGDEWDVYCRLNSECRWREFTGCSGYNATESHTECLRESAMATCLWQVTDLKHLEAPDPLPTNNTSGEEQDSNDLPAWGIALIGIVVVGAFIIILFIGRRAKCFRKPKYEDVL